MDRIQLRRRLGECEIEWAVESETPFTADERDRILAKLNVIAFPNQVDYDPPMTKISVPNPRPSFDFQGPVTVSTISHS